MFNASPTTAARPLSTRVTTEITDHVAVVTLARPKKMNALDMDMFRAVRDAALALRENADVRCVVVHGEGRAFCAGLDVKSEVSYLWRTVPCPVIAAVHGVCIGGGFQIAGRGRQRRRGDGSVSWRPSGASSRTWARRSRSASSCPATSPSSSRRRAASSAEEAAPVWSRASSGEHLASALATAKQIAAGSPDAAAAAKRLWHAAYDAPTDASADRRMLLLETELQKRLMGGWNQLACTVRGLGAPPALQPGFYARDDAWSQEADDEAEARVAALLDGVDFDEPARARPPSSTRGWGAVVGGVELGRVQAPPPGPAAARPPAKRRAAATAPKTRSARPATNARPGERGRRRRGVQRPVVGVVDGSGQRQLARRGAESTSI
ncbi:delta-3,5-delta-2,4-dienoyl-CoA isomerase [Aureococcus anophagefferens]|nr:delta-3,5-delta-2,4-dienoyl-CoA isomerase [Aureococcus anophagefferens]